MQFVIRVYQCDSATALAREPNPSDLIGETRFVLSQLLRFTMQRAHFALGNAHSSLKYAYIFHSHSLHYLFILPPQKSRKRHSESRIRCQ